MPTVMYSTEAKRRVLLQAVELMNEFQADALTEFGEILTDPTTSDVEFESTISLIRNHRKTHKFTSTLLQALAKAKAAANAGLYLEPDEAAIVRDGLYRLIDVEDFDESQVYDIISVNHIRQVIDETRWNGCIDAASFSKRLCEQVKEVLDSKNAARELLAELNT